MPAYRSRTTTHGRNMAGARGLWRATGMKDGDFGKPIIAVVNSFTQFVPGHVHLKDLGQLVAREIERVAGTQHRGELLLAPGPIGVDRVEGAETPLARQRQRGRRGVARSDRARAVRPLQGCGEIVRRIGERERGR